VALQAVCDAEVDLVGVSRILEEQAGVCCYILTDPSYSTCCVDFVSAKHINATIVIFFGSPCCSQYFRYRFVIFLICFASDERDLRVIYHDMTGGFSMDECTPLAEENADLLRTMLDEMQSEGPTLLLYDFSMNRHRTALERVSVDLNISLGCSASVTWSGFVRGDDFDLAHKTNCILYFGPENGYLWNLRLFFKEKRLIHMSNSFPYYKFVERVDTNRILSKRYSKLIRYDP